MSARGEKKKIGWVQVRDEDLFFFFLTREMFVDTLLYNVPPELGQKQCTTILPHFFLWKSESVIFFSVSSVLYA